MDPSRWILLPLVYGQNWSYWKGVPLLPPRFIMLRNEDVITFYLEVYCMETVLHFTCQIISKSKHLRFSLPPSEGIDSVLSLSIGDQIPSFGLKIGRTWLFIVLTDKQFCAVVRLGLTLAPSSRIHECR